VAPLAAVIATLTVVTIGYEFFHHHPPTWKAITPVFSATSSSFGLQFETSEVCLARLRKGAYVTRTISLFLEDEITVSFKPEVIHLENWLPNDKQNPLCFDSFQVSPPAFKFPQHFCTGQDTLRGAVTFEMKHVDRDDPQLTVVPQWEGKSQHGHGVSSPHTVSEIVGSTFHGPPKDVLIVPLVVKCVTSNLEPPIMVDPVSFVANEAAAASESPNKDTSKNHGKAADRPDREKIKPRP